MKKKDIKIAGNGSFVWYNILMLIILLGSVGFSIADKCMSIIPWPTNYENIIGVSSQIITAIASLVVSIIGIAISLQNEEFFGVRITKLYALRVTKHYSILKIIVTSILLCALNLTLYMCGLTVGAIGTLLVALMFLLKVVSTEIPIMAKEEKALLQILKDNLIICHIKKLEASKDLKEALKYLLYRKNLKELYLAFKDETDKKYNQYLLFKLLEFQQDLAFELKNNYSESDQRIVGSSLLDNVLDVALRHIEIPDDDYDEICKNRHLLTRVLFRLHELPASHEIMLHGSGRLFRYLAYSSKDTRDQDKLVSSILIILVSETVKAKDFSIIKVIRRELSSSSWCLCHASADLDVFMVLSLFLYYLYHSDSDVPTDLKEAVLAFINEGGMIEDDTRITSWKELFAEAANEFHVDYGNFLSLILAHSHNLEYWLHGTGGKFVVLETGYVTRWYLTHLFNTHAFRNYDYSTLLKESKEMKYHLKSFGDSCFDENKQFVPSEEMIQIISFYGDTARAFTFFRITEERQHSFFEFVNQIKVDELMHDTGLASEIDTTAFSGKIRTSMEAELRSEWGYDPNLKITNAERYFSIFLEKYPEACNFEDSIVDYCGRSLLADIEKSIQRTVLYKDEHFESGIHSMLHKNLKYITGSTKDTIPNFYIHDERIKQLFINVCNPLEEIKSRLLGVLAVVVENGFRFNFSVDKVEFRNLTEEELARQVEKYQRADGQYVFRGAFLPQEEITRIIKDKFTILTIVARHQVISSEDSVFELKPYSNGPEDE